MADYTNVELTDMHLSYRVADCGGPAAKHLYAERYPTRRIPSHNFFASLRRRLSETGSFQRADRKWISMTRTPAIEQNVLQQAEETP